MIDGLLERLHSTWLRTAHDIRWRVTISISILMKSMGRIKPQRLITGYWLTELLVIADRRPRTADRHRPIATCGWRQGKSRCRVDGLHDDTLFHYTPYTRHSPWSFPTRNA